MKRKESFSRKAFLVFNTLFMIGIIVIMVAPYLNILAKALNEGNDAARGGITIFPRKFTLENFTTVFENSAFPRAAIISVARVIFGTLLSLIVQFMAAYAFTHKDLVGRAGLLMFLMIPMYFGGGLIPTYIFLSKVKLLNNFLLYILSGCFSLYNMIIIRSYINGLPEGLKEAARIDGASEIKILWKIIVPCAKPILATITLWRAVALWSDWTTTMYFFTKKKLFTLQYLLVQVLKETERIQQMISEAQMRGEVIDVSELQITTESIRCAQLIITTIPIILTYPFLQKYFIKGVTLGAVKD